jgi:hypothetical protein
MGVRGRLQELVRERVSVRDGNIIAGSYGRAVKCFCDLS